MVTIEIAIHDVKEVSKRYKAKILYTPFDFENSCCEEAALRDELKVVKWSELFWGYWKVYECPKCHRRYVSYTITDSPYRIV